MLPKKFTFASEHVYHVDSFQLVTLHAWHISFGQALVSESNFRETKGLTTTITRGAAKHSSMAVFDFWIADR